MTGEFKARERVTAAHDLDGVPAGTAGKVVMVTGLSWIRYRVRFDNGVELNLLDGRHLVAAAKIRHRGAVVRPDQLLASPPASALGRRTRTRQPTARSPAALQVALGVCLVAACAVTALTYSYAATHRPDTQEYDLFWLGQLIWMVPATVRLVGRSALRAERLAVVTVTALFEFVPKVLRSPHGLLFHDELAHGSHVDLILQTGHTFVPNPLLPITEFFPGLHMVVVAMRAITGLSTFAAGLALLAILHVAALLGIWVLAERHWSPQVAGIAAATFAINPAFMFFDAQLSYESMGIVLVVWLLVCVAAMQAAVGDRKRTRGWFLLAVGVVMACAATHHLSSYFAGFVVCIVAGVTVALRPAAVGRRRRRRTIAVTVVFAGLTVVIVSAWLVFIGSGAIGYLAPHLMQGVGQVFSLIRREQPGRALYRASTVPSYEKAAAYLTPVILGVAVLASLARRATSPFRAGAVVVGLALFGLLYFASVPFMLTSQSEGARRLWAFAYIGLAVTLAPVVPAVTGWAQGLRRLLSTGVVVAAVLVVLVGNVSVQANAAYRFPGPYEYDSDTRSLTPELVAAAAWFRGTLGPGQSIVAPRGEALAFGSTGQQDLAVASSGFPIWELYFSAGLPSDRLARGLRSSGFGYLVVDRRMAGAEPAAGVYFATGEPAFAAPPTIADLTKFDRVRWAVKLYGSTNISVYRLDLDALVTCTAAAGSSREPAGCLG